MNLTAASIFQDNMVLQREKPLWIWGTGKPGSSVTVRIQGREGTGVCSDAGEWEVLLPELSASVEETLEICSGEETLSLQNVAIGEVWLAGGQSNMEFYMYYDHDYDAILSMCRDSLIRFYDVPRIASEEHTRRFDYSLYGFWRTADADNLKYFSAAAYYFARELRTDLGVPIGIVGCNWGGSRAACWMDRETVEKSGPVWLEDYENGLKQISDLGAAREAYFRNPAADPKNVFDIDFRNRLMRGVSREELIAFFEQLGEGGFGNEIGPWHEWRPNAAYEFMLKKVMPFAIRGAIYYQGESDDIHSEIYADMLEGMISLWRKGFRDDVPFLLTQLAPFEDGAAYPILRAQQDLAAQRLQKVWCASIGDVGNSYDIHPKQKRQVGERLALLARGHVYGEDILCDAPVGTELIREGNRLVIRCAHAEGGLLQKEDQPVPLLVYDCSGMRMEEQSYQVSVEKDRLVISFDRLLPEGGYKIAFAQTPYYNVNIYNMAGIPMKPFCLREK